MQYVKKFPQGNWVTDQLKEPTVTQKKTFDSKGEKCIRKHCVDTSLPLFFISFSFCMWKERRLRNIIYANVVTQPLETRWKSAGSNFPQGGKNNAQNPPSCNV